jgi:hypothetical protein
MGVPPGNRRVLVPRRTLTVRRRGSLSCQPSRGTAGLVSVPERYVAGGACPACPERSLGEPVEGTPEDARKDGYIRGRSK